MVHDPERFLRAGAARRPDRNAKLTGIPEDLRPFRECALPKECSKVKFLANMVDSMRLAASAFEARGGGGSAASAGRHGTRQESHWLGAMRKSHPRHSHTWDETLYACSDARTVQNMMYRRQDVPALIVRQGDIITCCSTVCTTVLHRYALVADMMYVGVVSLRMPPLVSPQRVLNVRFPFQGTWIGSGRAKPALDKV